MTAAEPQKGALEIAPRAVAAGVVADRQAKDLCLAYGAADFAARDDSLPPRVSQAPPQVRDRPGRRRNRNAATKGYGSG